MSEKKVAVVTGGSRGIGKEVALKFAREGFDVVIIDLFEDEEAKATVEELKAAGSKSKIYLGDISKEDQVDGVVEAILKDYGTIHVLVNNAGITKDNLLLRQTASDITAVITVNLIGTMLMTKACLRTFMRQKYGRIVNISSVVGIIGNKGQANYSASKAGVIGFTKTVAQEYGKKNITCNAVAPGFIETRMTEAMTDEAKAAIAGNISLGRYGTPKEVANLVYFLASDQSEYITGEVIRIDGGLA